jgi:hypothetical protein
VTLRYLAGRPQSGIRAAVICDECGREILSAADGRIVWRADVPDDTPGFAHQLCASRLERRRGGRCESEPLGDLPARLAEALDAAVERYAFESATYLVLRGPAESAPPRGNRGV